MNPHVHSSAPQFYQQKEFILKNVSLSILVLAGSLLPVMAQASGSQDTWTRGWGQGVSEFVIKGKGQSQLSLSCEDYGSQPATVIFTDASGHQVSMDEDKSLQVSIDVEHLLISANLAVEWAVITWRWPGLSYVMANRSQ
jgi:hypothetical protein